MRSIREGCVINFIDGVSYDYKGAEDMKRRKYLKSLRINMLHFEDSDVKENLEGVLISIKNWILEYTDKGLIKH
jgi:very-short-patch-repair endonuclease